LAMSAGQSSDTILVWFPFECILEMLQECFQLVNE